MNDGDGAATADGRPAASLAGTPAPRTRTQGAPTAHPGPPGVAPWPVQDDLPGGAARVVRVDAGPGGLPRVVVRAPAAAAEVYLQGAHVTHWAPAGARPVLWSGSHSDAAPGRPVLGGVPVHVRSAAQRGPRKGHGGGLVRARAWTFARWAWDSDDVVLTFELSSADVPGAARPFRLRYTVTVGASLTMELRVTNTGVAPLRLEESLSTHLAVGDVRETRLLGLGDLDRLDRSTGRRSHTPPGAQLRVVGQTDHLYRRPGAVTVVDWEGQRSVRVRAAGSTTVVVRHPWADQAATADGVGASEWSAMLCLEPGNLGDDLVVLPPGAQHTMVTSLDVGPLP